MIDFDHKRSGAALLATFACLAGCASPGPPLPPSLKLPEVVAATALTATRVGDAVTLDWTTPKRTTDKLLIAGPITAVICRNLPPAAPAQPASKAPPCAEVQRLPVTPGPSDATDPLPAPLATGPVRLLAYRVELLNAAGRTAGPSAPVFAAAGAAPGSIEDFRAEATKPGVLLRWQTAAGSGETVELDRTTVEAPAPAAAKAASPAAAPARKTGLPGGTKEPAELRFQAGPADAGGTLDRSALIDRTYRYTAQRVRTVELGGQTLELRSAPSAAVTVAVRDVFPPEVPAGLVAVPGFLNPGDQGSPATPGVAGSSAAQRSAIAPAIDLSGEPDVEPRVAGYRVYRREGSSGAWQLLTAELVSVAGWRDATVVAAHTYAYRVTAVSTAGNESAPSPEATETAPAQ